jgi:hypothetical protein
MNPHDLQTGLGYFLASIRKSKGDIAERKRLHRIALACLDEEPQPLDGELAAVRSFFARGLERIEAGERALCERLGVPWQMPERDRWALVGYRLASGEKEFRPAKPRGRPKKEISDSELLAEEVDELKAMPLLRGLTDLQLVSFLKALSQDYKDRDQQSFRRLHSVEASLVKRVSEGRAKRRAKRLPKM